MPSMPRSQYALTRLADVEDRPWLDDPTGDQLDHPGLLEHEDATVRQEGEGGREGEAAGDDVVGEPRAARAAAEGLICAISRPG